MEVGARVRAHFYYENGQKSKSWREAQVQKPREIGFPYTFGCEGDGVGGVWVSLCKGGHETRASKLANLFLFIISEFNHTRLFNNSAYLLSNNSVDSRKGHVHVTNHFFTFPTKRRGFCNQRIFQHPSAVQSAPVSPVWWFLNIWALGRMIEFGWLKPQKRIRRGNLIPSSLKKCHEQAAYFNKASSVLLSFWIFLVPVEVVLSRCVFCWFFLRVPPLVSAIFCTKVLSVNCHTDSGGGNSPVGSLVVTLWDDFSAACRFLLKPALSEAFFFCLPKRIDLIRKKGGILRHDHIISVLTQLLWISYGSRSEMVGESSLQKKTVYVLPHFLETSCIHP